MYVLTLARKPLSEPTIAANAIAHGTGALGIEDAHIESDGSHQRCGVVGRESALPGDDRGAAAGMFRAGSKFTPALHDGRYPANVILSREAADALEKVKPGASRYFKVFDEV